MKTIKKHIEKGNVEALTSQLNAEHLAFADRSGNTLLHFCAAKGNIETFRLLHEKGIDIHAQTKKGKTVLEDACNAGNIEIVTYCLEHKVVAGEAVRHALDGGNLEIFKMFVKTRNDIPDKLDCLHLAANYGNIPMVEYLIDTVGIEIDAPSSFFKGATALYDLGSSGAGEMILTLIEKGASVNAKCVQGGETPLFNFVQGGHLEGVQVLLDHGAEINMQDDLGKTPLMKAVWMSNVSLTRMLLDLGADPTQKDLESRNVTTYASSSESEALAVVLEYCAEKGILMDDTKSQFVIDMVKKAIENSEGEHEVKVAIDGGSFNFEEIPDEIEQFQEITHLEITNSNKLKSLNPKIFNLKNLEYLRIGFLPNLKGLPKGIEKLQKLKKLRIGFGGLEAIPAEIGLLTELEELEINGGYADFVPLELGNLTKLRKLGIYSCAVQFFPTTFDNFKDLIHLSIWGLDLHPDIPEFVFQQSQLKELYIQDNGIETIPERIMDLKHLKKFNFQGNPLVSPAKDKIKGGFKGLKKYFQGLAK